MLRHKGNILVDGRTQNEEKQNAQCEKKITDRQIMIVRLGRFMIQWCVSYRINDWQSRP